MFAEPPLEPRPHRNGNLWYALNAAFSPETAYLPDPFNLEGSLAYWHAQVEIQDPHWNPVSKKLEGHKTTDGFVLKQGESRETYITSTRRLLITEVEPSE
jgi:hypothetical protein